MRLSEPETIYGCFDGVTTAEYTYDVTMGESRSKILGKIVITLFTDNSEKKVIKVELNKVIAYSPSYKQEIKILALEKKIEFLEETL